MSTNTTPITATCLCGQLSATATIANTDLPLKVWLCGCDACRASSGMLAITCVFLPKGEKQMKITGKAERYQTSDGPSALIRCFCGTCGTFVYEDSPNIDRISLYAGALTSGENVEIAGMTYAASAKDHGMKEWLKSIKVYDENFGPPPEFTPRPAPSRNSHNERLHGKCHCGGVEFWVTRPNAGSYEIDSFVHPQFALVPDGPRERIVWWVRGGGKKYAALLCMCNSCRQATGFDIQPWAFIPLGNMIQNDGSPVNFGMGTLRKYKSSSAVDRYFCHTCGANVYFVEESRPLLIDVSVGILDAESGARAEDWLEWAAEPCYTEYAQNRQLAKILEEGIPEWHNRTGKGAVPT